MKIYGILLSALTLLLAASAYPGAAGPYTIASYDIGLRIYQTTLGDFNGDGYDDIALLPGQVKWLSCLAEWMVLSIS